MEDLKKLSEKIDDKKLRKMVVDFLADFRLSNKYFAKYPKMDLKDAASMFTVGGPGGSSSVERDVLNHTKLLVNLCESTAEAIKETYGLELNKDVLIAAAILHDLAKAFEWKRGELGLEHTGILLDHSMLGVAELYHRGFPEEVIHIIASHFGEGGPTPPRTFEALVFHHLDTMASMLEFRIANASEQERQLQLLLLNDEMISKMVGESSEKENPE